MKGRDSPVRSSPKVPRAATRHYGSYVPCPYAATTGLEPASSTLTRWRSAFELRNLESPDTSIREATVSGARLELTPVSALGTAPREHNAGRPLFTVASHEVGGDPTPSRRQDSNLHKAA